MTHTGLPHSEICGSELAWQLPAAYRSPATSFIGPRRQGIHRRPLIASIRRFTRPHLGKIEVDFSWLCIHKLYSVVNVRWR